MSIKKIHYIKKTDKYKVFLQKWRISIKTIARKMGINYNTLHFYLDNANDTEFPENTFNDFLKILNEIKMDGIQMYVEKD